MRKPWYKRKTFWAGVGMILTSLGGLCTGSMEFDQAVTGVITGLAIIFGRQAIEDVKGG